MLDKIKSFFGFTRMPFGRDLAPGMLHRHHDHTEAVARIAFGIDSRGITGPAVMVVAVKNEQTRRWVPGRAGTPPSAKHA